MGKETMQYEKLKPSGHVVVACDNSPEQYRRVADFKNGEIQRAVDFAESFDDWRAVAPTVVVAPGRYALSEGIKIGYGRSRIPRSNHGCIRLGSDRTWLEWRGPDGGWMIEYAVQEGQIDAHRAPCNLVLYGSGRANGMLLHSYHGRAVLDVTFWGCYRGLLAENSWQCDLRSIYAGHCSDTVVELDNWSVASLVGLKVLNCKTAGQPLLKLRAACSEVRGVNFDDCDTGDSPAVVMDGCKATRLECLRTELCRSPAIVRASMATGLHLSGMSLWEDPGRVGVLLKDSNNCEVERVVGYNFSEAVVREDPYDSSNQIEHIIAKGRQPEKVVDRVGLLRTKPEPPTVPGGV